MYPGIHVLGGIVLRTVAIYLVVLAGVRLSGNSVQNAMTGPDNTLFGGIAAALTLLLMNYLIADVSGGNRRFRKLIQGQPTLLVHNGSLVLPHMAKEHVSMDEL